MEKDFDEKLLHEKLENMPFWKQLFFFTAVCQRLLPSFSLFAKETGAAGEDILHACLEKAWENLLISRFNVDLSSEARQCEYIAPDTEDYANILVSSALDAASAISYLMQAFCKNDTQIIVEGTTFIYDSVDMYVQELVNISPNMPNFEDNILIHPLMQNELKTQREDIEFLQEIDDDPRKSMPFAKERWYGKKQSCLGISMD